MFICPLCKTEYKLPKCQKCEYEPACADAIWQLTDAPNIVTDGVFGKMKMQQMVFKNAAPLKG